MKNFEAQTAQEILDRLDLANKLINNKLYNDINGDVSFNVVEKITLFRLAKSLFNLNFSIAKENEIIEELKKISGTL